MELANLKRFLFIILVFVSAYFITGTTIQNPRPLVPVKTIPCGISLEETEKINSILRDVYNRFSLPGGLSIAISYQERLVYAGSVGYADRGKKTPLTPDHRMRIASVSKPVTSIAIMKLIEENKIRLSDPVFGETGILKGEYGIPTYENTQVEITVKQLLEHTAGGWGNAKFDPMFRIQNKNEKQFINKVLLHHPLNYLPGTKYEYSNFAYYVLGRVIEKASGMPYEDYVKQHVLIPCGITGMRIGGNTSNSDEVDYISTRNQGQYYLPMLHFFPYQFDAPGGWIANPVELLKLLARVDGFLNVADILTEETIEIMITPSAQNEFYALGWSVNKNNDWRHVGDWPGTTALLARNSDGFSWAILVNHRPSYFVTRRNFDLTISTLFWRISGLIHNWPLGTEL
jgi:CubicO group peptidase (beta-lactamase class C family)